MATTLGGQGSGQASGQRCRLGDRRWGRV